MPSSHSLPSTVWAVPSSGAKIFFARRPGDRESIVVWSGSTTRQIDLPPGDRPLVD